MSVTYEGYKARALIARLQRWVDEIPERWNVTGEEEAE